MPDSSILLELDQRGVATLTLNRPAVHNAFDDATIARLHEAIDAIAADASARVVVLRATGKSFSAGADLGWMRRIANHSFEDNVADARALADMLRALWHCPKPTVAAVHGAAFGGGVGLIACCDVAVAAESARFAFSEAKLGLTPATIGPFVIDAIGARAAKRLFLTAERFDACTAARLGLVSEVVPDAELDDAVARVVDALLAHGPQTMAEAKALVRTIAGRPIDDAMLDDAARAIAERRASPEGREGIAAFLEKRKPRWPGT